MGVFSKFNPHGAGKHGVLKQSHPAADALPWMPLNTTTRLDTQWGGAGKVHRVGPHERGKHFVSQPLGTWQNGQALPTGSDVAAAPSMSSGCGGACGGCGGNKGLPLGRGTSRQR